ncbi:hypothetical protein MPL1032_140050 [Mesorhizobium plurifarium]|uniref:Uncharacterized protein n=1 Tax=Mesorhizobium plurifarium TaxID=69974 RepID=A0A0K2VRY2_MESPL|nr:hypothetical protein MPL1032_140050 [Mesorhizobium plurifarium]
MQFVQISDLWLQDKTFLSIPQWFQLETKWSWHDESATAKRGPAADRRSREGAGIAAPHRADLRGRLRLERR